MFPAYNTGPTGEAKEGEVPEGGPTEESWEGRGSFWCWALLYLWGAGPQYEKLPAPA